MTKPQRAALDAAYGSCSTLPAPSFDYYFPKNGDAWASARRKGNPTLQLLYSLGFWALVVLALVAFVTSGTSTH
jgi:hypothetical protein